MPLAPEIAGFGDGDHKQGETGLTITGGGFGAFPGSVWMYQNADRSGLADQLTVGAWSDLQVSGVAIPASPANAPGTVYLFLRREDLAWSQGLAFTLSAASVAYPTIPDNRRIALPAGGIWVLDPDVAAFCEVDFSQALPDGVTLAEVSRTIPAGLTEEDAVIDAASGRFALKLSGARHASIYQVGLIATLSNAGTIPVTAPLRCFNG